MIGCKSSGPSSAIGQPIAQKKASGPLEDRGFKTSEIEVVQKNDDLEDVWKAHAKSSELVLHGDAGLSGKLFGVAGKMIKHKRPIADFKAESVIADKKKKLLVMMGKVKIRSLENKTTLFADKIKWKTNEDFVHAFGNVKVESPEYITGPYKHLVASTKLDQFGTPDKIIKNRS